MPHEITLSPDKTFVILTIRGRITAAIAKECDRAAHLFASMHGVGRHLMDLRGCRNIDSTASSMGFAIHGLPNDPCIDKHARVAVLVDPDDHSHDIVLAACQCANLDVSLFTDRSAAEKHLKSEL